MGSYLDNIQPVLLNQIAGFGNQASSTQYERCSLSKVINLSDGHTRQPLTLPQKKIVARFPKLFEEAQSQSQFELEEEFVDAFLGLARQSQQYDYDRYLLSYSSSSAISMLASYFRRMAKSIALIEPTFDNIPSILRREGVSLEVLPEEWLRENEITQNLASLNSDVIWIVLPNNPTGKLLNQQEFIELVNFCATNNRTLVCDFCFRFFGHDMHSWDQYEVLKRSNISFVTIEDTGKTWSTLDMKLGMLVCSDDLYLEIYHMHDDLLLNVSPFHLKILTEFIRDTHQQGLENTILYYVNLNRATFRRIIAGTVLEPISLEKRAVTMEWIRINAPFTGEQLWKALVDLDIHILPGSNFYWNTPEKGRQFIRIPMTRDPECVALAAPIIREVATKLAKGQNI